MLHLLQTSNGVLDTKKRTKKFFRISNELERYRQNHFGAQNYYPHSSVPYNNQHSNSGYVNNQPNQMLYNEGRVSPPIANRFNFAVNRYKPY